MPSASIRPDAAGRVAPARFGPGSPIRGEIVTLGIILLVALAVRVLAVIVLHEPIVSDAASYMKMAQTAISGPVMVDIYGNKALYSPGYPLLISVAFRLFGVSPEVVRGLNVALGVATVALTWAVGRAASGRPLVGLIAAGGMAVLIPAVAGTEYFERENLSTPLLLLYLLLAIRMVDSRRPWPLAILAGLVFGCGLLAGVSTIFTGIAIVGAVALRRPGWGRGIALLAVFGLSAALLLAPWVARNHRVLGHAVLSTNGGNNLYVGNNPAATGLYVGFERTPIAAEYNPMRDRLGELGLSDTLTRLAIDYVLANPGHVALLDLKKLGYFWMPDIPDRGDEQMGAAITAIRWLGAIQHVLILVLAVTALTGWRRWRTGPWLVVLTVCAFWSIHGLVYMITRYRAPAMPPMLVLAAIPVAGLIARRRPSGPVSML